MSKGDRTETKMGTGCSALSKWSSLRNSADLYMFIFNTVGIGLNGKLYPTVLGI